MFLLFETVNRSFQMPYQEVQKAGGFRLPVVVLFFALVLLVGVGGAIAAPAYVPGRLLVKFKPDSGQRALAGFKSRHNLAGLKPYMDGRLAMVKLPAGVKVADALKILGNDSVVDYAEPDYLLQAQQVPDDPGFASQWYLENTGQVVNGYQGKSGADISAPAAWQRLADSGQVVVAVIDSGVDLEHPDLAANLWVNPDEIPANGIDDDGNGKIDDICGWDFVDDDNQPQDATGHGTHVAGIIAAETGNSTGIAGVAPNVKIMALRFINAYDLGSTSDAIAAIDYAVAKGAAVINCSWGGAGYSRALRDTMAQAGALFVCAAGNASANIDISPFYPASYGGQNLLAVGATTSQDTLAWFSNTGEQSVDLAAPGFNIYSTLPARSVIWQEDFTSGGLDGWTRGGSPEMWFVSGPDSDVGISGTLALDPDGDYPAYCNSWIATPVLDLSRICAGVLTFRLLGSSQYGHDLLTVEATTNGSDWFPLRLQISGAAPAASVSGDIPYWKTVTVDMGRLDGAGYCRLRFRFTSDGDVQDKGWYLDNLRLTASQPSVGSYGFMHGTSMAAAVTSGVAAMAAGLNTGLTPAELKLILTSAVDHLDSLNNVVSSGGRLNADAVSYLAQSLVLDTWPASERQIDLSWLINTEVAGNITIERRTADQDDFTAIARVAPDSGSFLDTGLQPATTYIYRLRSVTSDGLPAVSNQAAATTPYTTGSGGGGGSGGCFILSAVPVTRR